MVVKEILELICIREFIKTMPDIRNGGLVEDSKGYVYNADAIIKRQDELAKQFLDPYVVSKPSKEV